jgi:hypothetical protein
MSNPVLDILIKATLLIVLALAVRIVWRRAAAATRHLIWALALGGILALPIIQRIGPAWHVLPIPLLQPSSRRRTPPFRRTARTTGRAPSSLPRAPRLRVASGRRSRLRRRAGLPGRCLSSCWSCGSPA